MKVHGCILTFMLILRKLLLQDEYYDLHEDLNEEIELAKGDNKDLSDNRDSYEDDNYSHEHDYSNENDDYGHEVDFYEELEEERKGLNDSLVCTVFISV